MVGWGCPSNHRRKKQKTTLLPLISSHLTIWSCLWIIILHNCIVDCSKLCSECDQGNCTTGTCVCFPGWRGQLCDECYGRISLPPGRQGVIYDGRGNYSKDLTCSWLLDAEQSNMTVRFLINDFATECVWDHLYIHDGDSAYSPLVAAFSGTMWGSKGKPGLKFKLSGRYAFVHFYSDAAFTLPGFNISYIVDDCALECSENGVCNNSVCECKPGWTGVNCDTIIDKPCPNNCSDHGNCINNVCQCEPDYRGENCNISRGELYIEKLGKTHPKLTGRASMTLTYDDKDLLWLLGGYKMGNQNLKNNMFRYVISSKTWEQLQGLEGPGENPWPRYGHSTVFYQDALYLYGGVSNTRVMNDLWRYNITSQTWKKLSPGPRNLSGHTAHVFNNTMVVIFGYSSEFGYSSKVLEYNFVTHNWTIVETIGSQVQGGYGHTSVFDTKRRKIYVYGGYHSENSSNYSLTDRLYQYDPDTKEWFILDNSGSPRYLHSAAIMNGLMVTFGGNAHKDTRLGKQTKCFASDFMFYDRDCNQWHTMKTPQLDLLDDSFDGFGHVAVSVDDTVYVFGGFNSLLKNDLLKIEAGSCSVYKGIACNSTVPGVLCHLENGSCLPGRGNSSCDHDQNEACMGLNTCSGCQNAVSAACQWCGNKCQTLQLGNQNCSVDGVNCTESKDPFCSMFHNCQACQDNEDCIWEGKCVVVKKPENKTATKSPKPVCSKKPCSEQKSCEECVSGACMWCSNLEQCIDTNSYVVSFHYGQCMDWTTKQGTCQANNCSLLKTCSDCQARPKCGWCNDKTGTGTGTCFEGGKTGPIRLNDTKPELALDLCPVDRWFFNDCPKCQCNGHSTCINDTAICENCKFPTTGPQCQYCKNGHYGYPENGGKCSPCSCNGQADSCNPVTGDCYCRTRGVTGKNCDKCDDNNKYSGDPKNGGTCYYHLNTDFQYTFNLSKREDSNYTQINFSNLPQSSDRDVDFTLNCSTHALINITYKSKSFPEEREYVSMRECGYFRTKFEHKNHAFGGKENTTFLVYVYDFSTPFMLQISFVQPDKINLLKFFIIFFSCFLSLLLIAAALWKIKHKYDGYRRRQQLQVEMQQMASRPFSTIAVEMDRKSDPTVVDKKDHLDSVLRRRKKTGNKPSSIALEPLADHKAAILTLIIQLPTGDSDYAPSGQSGLAVGSALVSVGSNRKQSLEHIKGDKPKIRKNLSYNHPDTCA